MNVKRILLFATLYFVLFNIVSGCTLYFLSKYDDGRSYDEIIKYDEFCNNKDETNILEKEFEFNNSKTLPWNLSPFYSNTPGNIYYR